MWDGTAGPKTCLSLPVPEVMACDISVQSCCPGSSLAGRPRNKQPTTLSHIPLWKSWWVSPRVFVNELLRGARKNLVVSHKRLYSALILLFIGNTLWRRIIYLVYSFKVVLMINFKEAKNTVENNNLTNKQNSEWYKNNRSRTRAVFPTCSIRGSWDVLYLWAQWLHPLRRQRQ